MRSISTHKIFSLGLNLCLIGFAVDVCSINLVRGRPSLSNDGNKSITFCSLDLCALDKQMCEESSSGFQSISLTENECWLEMPNVSQKSIPHFTLCCIESTLKISRFESIELYVKRIEIVPATDCI